jgi:hypothetical protein
MQPMTSPARINHLLAERLVEWEPKNRSHTIRLTMRGWDRYAKLKQVRMNSRTAFMAMKFNDFQLDHIVDTCFRPAVNRTGFQLKKATDEQPAGLIDDQIRAAILAARFVIADLSTTVAYLL